MRKRGQVTFYAVLDQRDSGLLCISNADNLKTDVDDAVNRYAKSPSLPGPIRVIYLSAHDSNGGNFHSSTLHLDDYTTDEILQIARRHAENRRMSLTHAQLLQIVRFTKVPPAVAYGNPGWFRYRASTPQPGTVIRLLNGLVEVDTSSLDEAKLRDLLMIQDIEAPTSLAAKILVEGVPSPQRLDPLVLSNEDEPLRSTLMAMDGRSFERLICSVLRELNFTIVLSNPGKDGGIDITATSLDVIHGGKFLFQCKRYREQSRIGRPVLQEFCGAAHNDRQHPHLVFITTSSFTREAIAYAREVGIRLIDFPALKSILSQRSIKDKLRA